MDFKLSPVTMPTTVRPSTGVRPAAPAGAQGVGGGFAGALKGALNSVSAAQNEASRLQK
jgi:flagellar hook-basal body complex protein FliE